MDEQPMDETLKRFYDKVELMVSNYETFLRRTNHVWLHGEDEPLEGCSKGCLDIADPPGT